MMTFAIQVLCKSW